MKRISVILSSVFLAISLCSCGGKSDTNTQDITDTSANVTDIQNAADETVNTSNSLGAFSASDVRSLTVPIVDAGDQKTEDIDFTSANVMAFNTVSIEEFLDDFILGEIEATNNGNSTLTNIKIYISVLDVSGIEQGTDSATCDYAAESNKKVSIEGIFDVNKDSADKIEVTAYEYVLQGQKYHVDLINSNAVKWDFNAGNADFEKSNVLSFSFEPIGADDGSYSFNATVHNNSDNDINVVEFRIILLDSENNQLHEMNGYTSDLAAGSTNTNKLYSSSLDNQTLSKINKLGVSSYSYWFSDDTVDEYKGYKVDLISVTSTGLSD